MLYANLRRLWPLPLLMLLLGCPLAHAGELVIFDGTLHHGVLWTDREQATAGIVPGTPGAEGEPAPDEIRLTFQEPYRSAGVAFFGGRRLDVPEGASVLRIECRVDEPDLLLSFNVKTDAGSQRFDDAKPAWRVDGEPGSTERLADGAWHVVDLDLGSIPGFTPGKSKLDGQVSVTNRNAGDGAVHIRRIALVPADAHTGGATATPQAAPATPAAMPKPVPATQPAAAEPAPAPALGGGPAPVVITIDPEPLQEVGHWGIATHNNPEWGPAWSITNYPASLEALYEDLGATIIRISISHRTLDDAKARETLRQAVLAATERGLSWYGVPWTPPTHLKTINHAHGKVDGKLNYLAEGNEDEVAAWLVDLTLWLQSQGVPLPVGLSPQNEPDYGPADYAGCLYTAPQLQKTVVELRRALDQAGLSDVLVIADEGAKPAEFPQRSAEDAGTLNLSGLKPGGAYLSDAAFRAALGILSTHTYDLHNNLYKAHPGYMFEFADAVGDLDIPVWMTEWETRHEHTRSDFDVLAETFRHFNRDMSVMRFNAWIHWQTWKSWLVPPAPEDTGDAVRRIRPGDVLTYRGVELTDPADDVRLRYGSDSERMKIEVLVRGPETVPLAEVNLAKVPSDQFQTISAAAPLPAGTYDVQLRFVSSEHWREASLNWFELGSRRIEAEAFSEKETVEHWTSSVGPAFNSRNRRLFVHDDGQTLHKRPLYYVFRKVWTHAPAGKGTNVRRVTTDTPDLIRGFTGERVPESYRQDVAAFTHGETTSMILVNPTDREAVAEIRGLTGTTATLHRYTEADASTVNVDIPVVGRFDVVGQAVAGITLPPRTLSVLVTSRGPTSQSR